MDAFDCTTWPHASTKAAIVTEEGTVRFRELRERAAALAERVRQMGAVALLLPNGVDLVSSYLACLQASVTAVPLNPKSTVPEIEFFLTHSPAQWLVAGAPELPHLRSVLRALPPARIVSIGELLAGSGSAHAAGAGASLDPAARAASAPAFIFFTSGSTNRPKGVVYSRRSLLSAIEPFLTDPFMSCYAVQPEEFRYLNTASVADTVGCIHILWTLLVGGTVILHPGFDRERYVEALERHRPTHSTLFLPHAYALLSRGPLSRELFRDMRMLCIAGDRTPVELMRRSVDAIGLVPLVGYGMTESFVISLNLRPAPSKFGSMGIPIPGVEVRIVDECGRSLPSGELGEIVIRSPQNMLGYWGDAEATDRAFLAAGWLKTGDLGRMDHEGLLWFGGRKKHIIIRGGENISPLEIEEVLNSHPAVEMAAVAGVPHSAEGEQPKAWVVPKDGRAVSSEELRQHLAEQLTYYKVPAEIEIVANLPKLRTGKLDRSRLRATGDIHPRTSGGR